MLGNEGMIRRRQTMHSAGYRNTDGMIRRHHYFEFDVNNTQVISGLFSTISGQEISVDWGDGSARDTYSGTDQAWSHDYGSAVNATVRVFGSVVLTKFTMTESGADISFDVAHMPASLTYLVVYGSNTLSGDIANLSSGLTRLEVYGSNTLSGDIANLPSGLTYLVVYGSNTLSGDIANLSSGLTRLEVYGSNTLSGDIANLPSGLTYLNVGGSNTLSGDVANLPSGLTYLNVGGSNTLSGDVANLPSGLTYLYAYGSNTLSGDIANLPSGLTYLVVYGSNTLSGDIANLSSGLTRLEVYGSNTLSGDIANLPSGLTYLSVGGSNTIADYTSKTWTTKPATFKLIPVSPGGLSTAEIDQLLIDLDDDLTWASGDVITLTGTNAVPSSASDAAVNNMTSEGATVTTNT